jgi:hypothetical protein
MEVVAKALKKRISEFSVPLERTIEGIKCIEQNLLKSWVPTKPLRIMRG